MTLRKTIFWIHLPVGLAVGLIVATMSATGVAIAFEHEILDWADRDVNTVVVPANASRRSLEQLDAAVATQRPEFKTTTRMVPRELDRAFEYRAGRDGMLYVNPYTGAAMEPKSATARNALRALTNWHRWLGREGEGRETGRLITGIANLGFLFLCLSGLYMWWPRSWSAKAWRPAVWFVGRLKGRAREFNWHNVFGSWNVLVLIVIVISAVVMSFQWANRLVFTLAGEEPPQRGLGAQAAPARTLTSAPGQERLTRDAVLDRITQQYPDWQTVSFESAPGARDQSAVRPLTIIVTNSSLFQQKGRVQLSVDPYRGDVLGKVGFDDRTSGTRARIWLRFLHTGEAFGIIGKIIASLATLGSLFLVYTGFALSFRRFFPRSAGGARVEAKAVTKSA